MIRAMSNTSLHERFADADIPLRIASSPRDFDRRIVDRDPQTIFMIDVRSRRGSSRRQEFILLYCGQQAQARVIATDRRRRQALLDVNEPETRLKRRRWDRAQQRRVEDEIVIPASRRRMLVGMDERHLFICPLTESASSVEEAHRKLAPETVSDAAHRAKVKRQGEWFFVPITRADVMGVIDEAVAAGLVETRIGISAGGRPHRVDKLLRLGAVRYARGKVRHPDHRVLELKTWHEVHGNTELVAARPEGMTWVD